MKTTSFSASRRNLTAAIDSVNADRDALVITRDRRKSAVVLMSLEDDASFEETRHLLASPRNAERLLEAVADLDAGAGHERDLID